jgi:ATP-dependent DNA ligase
MSLGGKSVRQLLVRAGATRIYLYPRADTVYLARVDLRGWTWTERRERLELLARAFVPPMELSPVVQPSEALALDIVDGRLEGIVLKDRESTYRAGSRAGWWKVKDPSWWEREAWRFDRR